MTPLLMTRDDALALTRAVGSKVVVTFHDPPGSARGVLVDVDMTGRAVIDTDALGRVVIPVMNVTTWALVE